MNNESTPASKFPDNLYHLSQQNYIQQVSIDCVIFGYQDKQLSVLVPKLSFTGDFWALPTGFIYQSEGIDEAAARILYDRTGLREIYLKQFSVFGAGNRNSNQFWGRLIELNPTNLTNSQQANIEFFNKRFISIGYYALVDINKVIPRPTELDESIHWYSIGDLPPMIMDHNSIINKALEALRHDFHELQMAYNLLPQTFTMKEVQHLYETVYNKPFAANNFPKMILDQNILERLEKKYTGAHNKAPYLYRLIKSVPDEVNME